MKNKNKQDTEEQTMKKLVKSSKAAAVAAVILALSVLAGMGVNRISMVRDGLKTYNSCMFNNVAAAQRASGIAII